MMPKKTSNHVDQGSNEQYLAGNAMLEFTTAKLEPPSNVLAPHAFACQILICFVSRIIIFSHWQKN